MLIINNIPLLVSVKDIIYDLRLELMSEGISQFKTIKYTNSDIMTNCIFHKDNSPSFGILLREKKKKDKILQEGHFHCFSCGKSGSLSELVSHCYGYEDSGKFGEQWLIDKYSNFELDNRENIFKSPKREIKVNKPTYIQEQELSSYRYYHNYMFKRGLTKELIDLYDIGFQKDARLSETSSPFHAITFPVRDIKGNCLFVAKRAINSKLFVLPENIDKPLYGIYELQYLFPKTKHIYICESVFNALTLVRFGLPAIALFGTSAENQVELLKSSPYRTFYLCLDNDEAGKKGIKRLTAGLKDDKLLYVIDTPPDGTDINNHWEDGIEWFSSLSKYRI